MMGRAIMLTGGARSGKSMYALKLVESYNVSGKRAAFVATAVAMDDEMEKRIVNHQAERKDNFDTFEEPEKLAVLLKGIVRKYDLIIVDCLTFFVNNLIFKEYSDDQILSECGSMLDNINGADATIIFVTNEVGFGIVPDNSLARRFRDLSGRVNRMFAESSDEVYLMVSGIPMKVK
jgi:adenosylcobinamide kinase/adenosylcobinamide-phosphate guanylyltransferase